MTGCYDSIKQGMRKYALPLALSATLSAGAVGYSGENVGAERAETKDASALEKKADDDSLFMGALVIAAIGIGGYYILRTTNPDEESETLGGGDPGGPE